MDNEKEFSEIVLSVPSDEVMTKALDVCGKLMDYAREATITEREIARYNAVRDVAITAITKKYKFLEDWMNRAYDERWAAIEKCFQIIDKGMEQNDKTLIVNGLGSLTNIVTVNPFGNFPDFQKMLRNGTLPKLGY